MKKLIVAVVFFGMLKGYAQKNRITIDSLIKAENYTVLRNIKYGEADRNVLDLWIASNRKKSPLVIYIHGGGFGSGSKEEAYNENNLARIKQFLAHDISFATINYRFINNDDGIKQSLNDAKRALQFLRYHADKYNLIKNKIGLMGASAGASSSLWIGFFDDMANLTSSDPIERETTKVSFVIGIAAAHSMNLNRWKDMLNIDKAYLDLMTLQFINTLDKAKWMKKIYDKNYIASIDFFDKMDPSDPPFFIINYGENTLPRDIADFHHHPLHAKRLKDRADSLKIKNVIYAQGIGMKDASGQQLVSFVVENLIPLKK